MYVFRNREKLALKLSVVLQLSESCSLSPALLSPRPWENCLTPRFYHQSEGHSEDASQKQSNQLHSENKSLSYESKALLTLSDTSWERTSL